MFTNSQSQENTPMVDAPPLRKYMFDRSFDNAAGANAAERPRGPVTLKPEQVDALKKEAYDIGFAAGQKAGAEEHEQFLRATLAQIDSKATSLIASLSALHKQQDTQLRNAIIAIARKLLPDFTARQGLQEIQGLMNTVIDEMIHEPRLVVRVNETDFDAINSRIQEMAAQKAYPGKVVVFADAEITRGNCRVEWADGGVERNVEATWKAVEETVAPENSSDSNSQQEINHG